MNYIINCIPPEDCGTGFEMRTNLDKFFPYIINTFIILAVIPVILLNFFRKKGETKDWIKVTSLLSILFFTSGIIILSIAYFSVYLHYWANYFNL